MKCSRCPTTAETDFYPSQLSKGVGLCKVCAAEYRRGRKDTTSPEQHRQRNLKKRHGLSLSEYEALLEQQDHCCAICETSDPGLPSHPNFSVDHDHQTGKIRGLLCRDCNRALGLFRDSATILHAAHEYLS